MLRKLSKGSVLKRLLLIINFAVLFSCNEKRENTEKSIQYLIEFEQINPLKTRFKLFKTILINDDSLMCELNFNYYKVMTFENYKAQFIHSGLQLDIVTFIQWHNKSRLIDVCNYIVIRVNNELVLDKFEFTPFQFNHIQGQLTSFSQLGWVF